MLHMHLVAITGLIIVGIIVAVLMANPAAISLNLLLFSWDTKLSIALLLTFVLGFGVGLFF
jgi:hypothetical protein